MKWRGQEQPSNKSSVHDCSNPLNVLFLAKMGCFVFDPESNPDMPF
jgi:hypothetical protein